MTRRLILILLGIGLILVSLSPWAIRLYTDWLWFEHVGYEFVFGTRLAWQWAIGLGVGLVFSVFIFANLKATRWAFKETSEGQQSYSP